MSDYPTGGPSERGQSMAGERQRLVYVVPDEAGRSRRDDGISLRELWNILWEGKWLAVAVTSFFAVCSVAYALLATEWYRAEVLLAPAESAPTATLAGQLGGLAALAGVNIGGGNEAAAVATLKSREFARAFIEDFELLPVFFADDWDDENSQWGIRDPAEWPDVRDAVKYFHENVLKVSEDRQSSLVTLAIEWIDPEAAAEWANALAYRLNETLRAVALRETEANIGYLEEESARTSLVALQQTISRLLEGELQKLMMARGREEFAFRIVDVAHPPKYRERPKRTLLVIIGTALGAMLSMVVVLLVHSVRNTPQAPDT